MIHSIQTDSADRACGPPFVKSNSTQFILQLLRNRLLSVCSCISAFAILREKNINKPNTVPRCQSDIRPACSSVQVLECSVAKARGQMGQGSSSSGYRDVQLITAGRQAPRGLWIQTQTKQDYKAFVNGGLLAPRILVSIQQLGESLTPNVFSFTRKELLHLSQCSAWFWRKQPSCSHARRTSASTWSPGF